MRNFSLQCSTISGERGSAASIVSILNREKTHHRDAEEPNHGFSL
jgi:hypothetical protein